MTLGWTLLQVTWAALVHPSSVQSNAKFPLFPSIYYGALFVFPHRFFLHWIVSSAFPFARTCIWKHCIVPSVQHYCSCPNTFVAQKQMCRLWTAAIVLGGMKEHSKPAVYTGWSVYRIWYFIQILRNIFGIITQELQVVIRCLVRYPCPCLRFFYWVGWFGTSSFTVLS